MKRRFCIILAAASLMLLSSCDGGLIGMKMEEPPDALVMVGDLNANVVVNKDVWDGQIYENISEIDSALNVRMTTCEPDDALTIDFGKYVPDTLSINCTDYKITSEKTEIMKKVSLGYTSAGNVITADSCDYDTQTDIRLYTVTAFWDENSAKYSFALRNKNNIDEGISEDRFLMDCEYYVFSAEYDSEHSHTGGTLMFTDYESFEEFCTAHGAMTDGEVSMKEKFDEYNVIVTYDFDSITPTYLAPKVTVSGGRIDVSKNEEYEGRLDTTFAVRGYFTLVSKEVCEVFDITGDNNIYYSWGESFVTYTDKEE